MSAIAGIITSSTDDLRFISAMTDLLAHRGPHGDGILWMQDDGSTRLVRDMLPSTNPIPGRAALGHRLLASMGDSTPQPFTIDNGRYWISYDGALYNYRELRATLEALGHSFTTHSDVEVILTAYKQYGQDCFQHFNGAWAVAILDTQEKTLLLARDPFGLRPLYYWSHRGRLAFASEIKALFAIPEIRPKLERQSLTEFIRYGNALSEQKTAFAHILALPPGQAMRVKLDESVPVKPTPYAQTSIKQESLDDAARIARFRELFFSAIDRQRQSLLNVGTCLTGGLDSTAIACALRQQMGADLIINSFSAIFEEAGYDERTWVTAANGAAHTLSNWVMPQADDFMTELDTLLWHQDEPFASISSYAQWCVARAAREAKVDVLLDGRGATEHFGIPAKPSLMQKLMPHRNDEARMVARLLTNQTANGFPSPLTSALRGTDRNSMAFSVETRLPFFDQPLAAFARSLPGDQKENRQLMRTALKDVLPEPIVTRAAMPAFHMPLGSWLHSAIIPAFLRDIKHARIPLVPVVHGGELRELVSRQLERPDVTLAPLLFRLFIANRWMQRFNVAPVS